MTTDHRLPTTLAGWLEWQQNLHPRRMDLDLDRVRLVAGRLGLLPFPSRVITVGGTNGKGSTVLLLEALLRAQHSVGTYTSPHLQRYTERIRVDGQEVDESELCRACEVVETARGNTPLTYFEFATLSALCIFRDSGVDTIVLEVGMGGRLDATNILDADVAVITSIGLDHCDWLGHDRETIALEKAGIFRANTPAICADRNMPDNVQKAADEKGANLKAIERDFDVTSDHAMWQWSDWQGSTVKLAPMADVLPDNLAGALGALTAFGAPQTEEDVAACLHDFAAPGRRQIIPGDVEMIFDVGHNAEAVRVFSEWLVQRPARGRTLAVLGMLDGKPVDALVNTLAPHVDQWFAGDLPETDRGLSAEAIAAYLPEDSETYADIPTALDCARGRAESGDRVIVCGSFYTVGAAMDALDMKGLAA